MDELGLQSFPADETIATESATTTRFTCPDGYLSNDPDLFGEEIELNITNQEKQDI